MLRKNAIRAKRIYFLCLTMLLLCLPPKGWSNHRLAITYASFNVEDYNNYKSTIDRFYDLGFRKISLVPTYAHEYFNLIDDRCTPHKDTIKACIQYILCKGMGLIYKPHIDPTRYMWGSCDQSNNNNPSWRKGVSWRAFFDIDPIESQYYEVIIQPALASLKEILESNTVRSSSSVRLELGAELMNSMIRYGHQWEKVAKRVRKYIKTNKMSDAIRISHNFTHHFEIEGDYLLRMNKKEKKYLKKYMESLDEISISQYMDLTIFMQTDSCASEIDSVHAVAKAILHYHNRLRNDILGKQLKIKHYETYPINIGEFGVGVGGLKHPNWHGGCLPDKTEQRIGLTGLLESLGKFEKMPVDKELDATIWSVGPTYDIFGFYESCSFNKQAIERIKHFLN